MRSATVNARYAERLGRLADNQWPAKIVAVAANRWPDWDDSVVWSRSYGRFNPGGTPYAALLLEQSTCSTNICFIEVFEDQPPENTDTVQYFDQSLGWLQLRRFPNDPCLTSLSGLLEKSESLEVLRYRPNKRCTFRLVRSDDTKPIIGKIFADGRGEQIHRESVALWEAANSGRLQFDVAQPIGWDKSTATLWQHSVAGHPLIDQLFCSDGGRMAERIGVAAASITQSRLSPSMRFCGTQQMRRSNKYAAELVNRFPDLESNLGAMLDSLVKNHKKASGRPLKPLHGAPHAHQWLISDYGLGLVDFDRVCVGDPELDAATFIGELDFEDSDKYPMVELKGSFLQAYQQSAGRLDPSLFQTYRCHKRLAKALKAARSIKVNGESKARRHIEFAQQALELKCVYELS